MKSQVVLKDMFTFASVNMMGVEMNTEPNLKPYTIEELHEMIAISEQQFATGQWKDFDKAMDEIDAELAAEDNEAEIAKAL